MIVACREVFPCTCGGPHQARTMRGVAEWYSKQPDVALIFEGKVIKQELRSGSVGAPASAMSMTTANRYRLVDFAIARMFQGVKQEHFSVVTGLGTGDCGYNFQTGQTYLVYASAGPARSWFTSICSGTNSIDDAGTALRLLTGEKPTADDLLSPQEYAKQYIEKVLPTRTGSVCGKVMKPDGTPLKGATVELWEPRDDGLPSRSASDPNTSTDDGHFCIKNAEPGHYLLVAEDTDFDNDARYISFYPGGSSREQAIYLDIEPGVRLPDARLTTFRELLYTIRIRVTTPDGTRLSYKNGCGVAVDSEYHDPLSYHISHTLEGDGSYTFGYIPAGKYLITTYFQPNFESGEFKSFPEASEWKAARQELILRGNTEVVIQMEPAKPN